MAHISYSALKNWDFCPYYHKLTHIDKIKIFQGNVFTVFGTALHEACEKVTLNETIDSSKVFLKSFKEGISELKDLSEQENNLIKEMEVQGIELSTLILKALNIKFPGYKVFSAEEELYQPIFKSPGDYDYKGFLDLVVQTPDGKYHIIDWKTCSWGWDFRRRTDSITTYQLTYYKNFFCQKHDIDHKNVETYFGLLKRTAKKEKIEIFKVSSGRRKVENALKILNKAMYNIHNNNHPKNKLKCGKCEFKNTQYCP
jgi:ATP-dependent exoDNAse (exonuclease V) beta subunit